MADKKTAEQYYSPPPKLGKWEGFKLFLWNGETSQCLGRTGSSWAKIIFFYIIFYSALAGFFAAMLAVFYQTLDNDKPKWQLDDGLIGSNPGLGFRPMPPESNVESTLVWYDKSKPENMKYWVEEIDKFLDSYKSLSQPGGNRIKCDFDTLPKDDQVCVVDVTSFQSCTRENNFGFDKASPCIFLKLNKIYNWYPDMYNDTEHLPQQMPLELKQYITDEAARGTEKKNTNVIWVSCEGENPADVENIGPVQYIPRRGFPGYYFPFKNNDGYMPPLVAVYFERPQPGVLINIECKAWAKNIHHDRSERRGSVHFELMID